MKSFTLKLIIIAALLLIVDLVAGKFFDHYFLNVPEKNTEVSAISQALFHKKCDVLIMGPSTASHNYDPTLLSDSLKLDVFNSGLDGCNIVYSDAVLESYLERCKLKLFVLDVTESQFEEDALNRMDMVKLFYGNNKYVTQYFDEETDWQKRLKLKSSLYKYNKSLSDIIRVSTKGPLGNGYTPLSGQADVINKTYIDTFDLNPTLFNYFDRMIEVCDKYNIPVIMVVSPKEKVNTKFCAWLDDYVSKCNGEVYLVNECSNDYFYNHPELFRDGGHLNKDGAELFSQIIVSYIKDNELVE